ncbi:hypothetical protein SNEBB_009355 [Seison nebaliae]|nr:hypothetical protein SNEBB_009355 [Seison nebaliae]
MSTNLPSSSINHHHSNNNNSQYHSKEIILPSHQKNRKILHERLVSLNTQWPWYHGNIGREEAENILNTFYDINKKTNNNDGTYLVRDSQHYPGNYTLSVVAPDHVRSTSHTVSNGVEHYRIHIIPRIGKNNLNKNNRVIDCTSSILNDELQIGLNYFIDQEVRFPSLQHLIQHYNKDEDGLCTQLRRSIPADTKMLRKSSYALNHQMTSPLNDQLLFCSLITLLRRNSLQIFNEEELSFIESIGGGEFSVVLLAQLISTQTKVAVKIFPNMKTIQKNLLKSQKDQVDHNDTHEKQYDVLIDIDHKNNESNSYDHYDYPTSLSITESNDVHSTIIPPIMKEENETNKSSPPKIRETKLINEKLCEEHDRQVHEIALMVTLKHENLVRLIGTAQMKLSLDMPMLSQQYSSIISRENDIHVCLISEYCDLGSCVDYLRSRGRVGITQLELVSFATDICRGMQYLESMHIVHSDIAARNVLLTTTNSVKINSNTIIPRAKVSDFGSAFAYIDDDELSPDDSFTQSQLLRGDKINKCAIKWTAPEALRYRRYSSKSDMWSFGILLWELFTYGRTPYPTIYRDHVLEQVENGYRMKLPSNSETPNEIRDLTNEAWNLNVESRPTFSSAMDRLEKLLTKCHNLTQLKL